MEILRGLRYCHLAHTQATTRSCTDKMTTLVSFIGDGGDAITRCSRTNKVTLIGPASSGDVTLTLPATTDTVAVAGDINNDFFINKIQKYFTDSILTKVLEISVSKI